MGTLGSGTQESGYGFYSREHEDKTKRPVLIFHSAGGIDTPGEDNKAILSERLVSGAYRVETWCPNAYSSTWQLQIVNGRITGMSKWTCCPGPRNDPLTGHIDGNAVTITRDCTGQGTSGPCSQIYSGKLNSDVIEGSFTLNERQNFGTWKLFLNSEDDPSLTLQDPTDGRRNNRKHPADGGLHPGSETAAPEKSHLFSLCVTGFRTSLTGRL
jgi:hypothetical protein